MFEAKDSSPSITVSSTLIAATIISDVLALDMPLYLGHLYFLKIYQLFMFVK